MPVCIAIIRTRECVIIDESLNQQFEVLFSIILLAGVCCHQNATGDHKSKLTSQLILAMDDSICLPCNQVPSMHIVVHTHSHAIVLYFHPLSSAYHYHQERMKGDKAS